LFHVKRAVSLGDFKGALKAAVEGHHYRAIAKREVPAALPEAIILEAPIVIEGEVRPSCCRTDLAVDRAGNFFNAQGHVGTVGYGGFKLNQEKQAGRR